VEKKLSPKQQLFISEYLKDKNGTQAAIRAGYKENTASETAYELLRKPQIMEAVDAALAKVAEKNEVTAIRIIKELSLIAFSDLQSYVDVDPDTGAIRCKGFDDMPPETSRALESISEDRVIREASDGKSVVLNDKIKFKMHDKVRALEMLGKHLNLFNEASSKDIADAIMAAVSARLSDGPDAGTKNR
jgi:phage terminase small subunit